MPIHSTGIGFIIHSICTYPAQPDTPLPCSYGRTLKPNIGKFLLSSRRLFTYPFDLQRIDEMIDIVELLCGEASFQGYELLRQDYLDREERALGVAFADAQR